MLCRLVGSHKCYYFEKVSVYALRIVAKDRRGGRGEAEKGSVGFGSFVCTLSAEHQRTREHMETDPRLMPWY